MQVGELIDLLEKYRGRGDTVEVATFCCHYDVGLWPESEIHTQTDFDVTWDEDSKRVRIAVARP